MLQFLLRRLLYMVPTLLAISIVAFVIIQLPPGDFLTTMVAAMAAQDEDMDQAAMAALEEQYGLGQPVHVQYLKWMQGIIFRGDFGDSFGWNKPVSDLVWGRLALTFVLSLASLLFVWVVAFPIGIYSAVKQYSIGDYFATFIGFLGPRHAQFSLGSDIDVHRLQILQSERGRPIFT